MIFIKHYKTEDDLKHAKQLCISHRLFVNGWVMREWLEYDDAENIFILFKNEVPIGAAIVTYIDDALNFGIFIRKSERRNGYGTMLVDKATKLVDKKLFFTEGVKGSWEFFEQTKLEQENRTTCY